MFIIPKSYICSPILGFHSNVLHQFIFWATGSAVQSHNSNQFTQADKRPKESSTVVLGVNEDLCFVFASSAEKRMINMEVEMPEEGRDAMGLLSLMIGLSECSNGLGCQGWWFTELLPVIMPLRQPGEANQRVQLWFYNNIWKDICIHTRYRVYIYVYCSFSFLQSQVWFCIFITE